MRLRGTGSNRSGIGARVAVTLSDDRRIVKVNDGKSGYLSQSDLSLYFGLAGTDKVRRIDVRWPSGRQQQLIAPQADSRGTIELVEQ